MTLLLQKFNEFVSSLSEALSPSPSSDYLVGLFNGSSKKLAIGALKGRNIYLSKCSGVYADASLSDATVGHDDSVAVQAAITASPAGSVFVVDGKFKLQGIQLRSGDTVLGFGGSYDPVAGTFPATGVILATGGACIFRNANFRSNYNSGSPVSDFSLVLDRDITIENLFINNNSPAIGGANVQPALVFLGVSNLTLRDLYLYKPAWKGPYGSEGGGIVGAYLDGALIEGVYVFDPVTYALNGGGTFPVNAGGAAAVILTGPLRRATVRRFAGYSSTEPIQFFGGNPYATFAGFSDVTTQAYPYVYGGDITEVLVEDIRFREALSPVYFNIGNESIFARAIDRVVVRDIQGPIYANAVLFADLGSATSTKTYGSLIVEDLNIYNRDNVGNCSICGLQGRSNTVTFQNVIIRNVQLTRSAGHAPSGNTPAPIFVFGNFSVVDNLQVSGIQIEDAATAGVNFVSVITANAVTVVVNNVSISNVTWRRTQGTTAGALFSPTSAAGGNLTLGNVTISNVILDRVSNAVNQVIGTFANLTITGLTHVNANSNPSVTVASGKTLSRLRAAGSNTLLLTGGAGTITSKDTDGTEDL